MTEPSESPPRFVWLMGFTNSTYGFAYAVILVTLPQLLAAQGMAEPAIASLTSLALIVALAVFAVAPALDTMMSRRLWSIATALAAASLTFLLLVLPNSSPIFAPVFATDALMISLFNAAMGGWLGAALPKGSDETLGTWFTIGNGFGFGLGALSQHWLMTHLPRTFAAATIVMLMLTPLAILPLIPLPEVRRSAIHESFGRFARDIGQLVRQPLIWRIILLFVLPCAAFTLTNAFGGLGRDFHASAALVDIANGIGPTVIGFVASLLARGLLKWLPAPLLYLATGMVGAAVTLSLLGLSHTPATYLLAVIAENAAQSIAQVSQSAIIFRSIREGSPLATSQFGLLSTAAVVPYAYMQMLDGYGYKLAGGVSGSLLMDASVSLGACVLLAIPVVTWLRASKLHADTSLAATATS